MSPVSALEDLASASTAGQLDLSLHIRGALRYINHDIQILVLQTLCQLTQQHSRIDLTSIITTGYVEKDRRLGQKNLRAWYGFLERNPKIWLSTRLSYLAAGRLPLSGPVFIDAELHPADVVIMLCVQPDDSGEGVSLLYYLSDLLKKLNADEIALLEAVAYPTQFGTTDLLRRKNRRISIRYNRLEIDRYAALTDASLTAKEMKLLLKVDDILSTGAEVQRILLRTGDCLIVDNTKVLHGRSKFSSSSRRLLKRVRLHAEPRSSGLPWPLG